MRTTWMFATGLGAVHSIFALPYTSTTIPSIPMPWAVNCQGSRNCSEKLARTSQALASLASFIWLKDSISASTRLKFNQHSAAHLIAVACCEAFCFQWSRCYCWILGGCHWGFWTKLSRTHRNSLYLVNKNTVWLSNLRHNWKIQVISHHFLAISHHPMLVLGSGWPCCWDMKSLKRQDRDSAPSFRTTFRFGPSLERKIMKARKDYPPIRSTLSFWLESSCVLWCMAPCDCAGSSTQPFVWTIQLSNLFVYIVR